MTMNASVCVVTACVHAFIVISRHLHRTLTNTLFVIMPLIVVVRGTGRIWVHRLGSWQCYGDADCFVGAQDVARDRRCSRRAAAKAAIAAASSESTV
jgi:hypothetical protein